MIHSRINRCSSSRRTIGLEPSGRSSSGTKLARVCTINILTWKISKRGMVPGSSRVNIWLILSRRHWYLGSVSGKLARGCIIIVTGNVSKIRLIIRRMRRVISHHVVGLARVHRILILITKRKIILVWSSSIL